MRILHVAPMYFPALGGAELHLKEISEGLAARGHQVTVFTANACNSWHLADGVSAELPPFEVVNGVTVLDFIRMDNSGVKYSTR